MATVSENSRHSYVDPDQFVRFQLDQTRRRIKSNDLMVALVLAGLLLVGYVLVFTLLDHWVIAGGFRPVTRLVLLSLVVITLVAILYRSVLRRLDSQVNPLFAARVLDQSHADPDGSLLTLVDLQVAGRQPGAVIQKTLEKRAALQLVQVHVEEAVDRRSLIRLGTALFLLVLLTCLYAVFSPKSISLLRPLTLANTHVATRTVLESILPGNASVPAGTHLQFQVDVAGIIPPDVRVLYTTTDRRFVDEPLTMQATEDDRRFQVVLPGESNRGVRQDLQYRIVAGDASSELFQIRVIQPPSAQVTSIRYQFPDYMKLPDRVEQSGMIDAWQDTSATITAESNVPLRSAVLQLSDEPSFASQATELPVTVDQTKLSAKLKLQSREDGTFPRYYRIQVTDFEGHQDPEPVVYTIDVQQDQAPVVRLLDPSRDLQVAANAIIPLLVEAEDPDFLLRNVSLHYAVNGQPRQPAEFLMDASSSGFVKRWAGSWEFQLALLRLKPGDIVSYHIEARDNRPPLGNVGRTGELNLRIEAELPDEKVREQLAQDREMQEQQLQDRRERQQQTGELAQQTSPQEASEQPQPGNSTTESDNRTPATPPADPRQTAASGQTSGNRPDPNSTRTPQDSAPPEPQTSDSTPPENQTNPPADSPQRQPVQDDEALQRLIEAMNQQPDSDTNNSPSASENPAASSAERKTNGSRTPDAASNGQQSPNGEQSGSEQQANPQNLPDKNTSPTPATPDRNSPQPSATKNDSPTNTTDPSAPLPQDNAPDKPMPGQQTNSDSNAPDTTNPQPAEMPGAAATSPSTNTPEPSAGNTPDKTTSPEAQTAEANSPDDQDAAAEKPPTGDSRGETDQPGTSSKRGQQDPTQPDAAAEKMQPENAQPGTTEPNTQPGQAATQRPGQNKQDAPKKNTPEPGNGTKSGNNKAESPQNGASPQNTGEKSTEQPDPGSDNPSTSPSGKPSDGNNSSPSGDSNTNPSGDSQPQGSDGQPSSSPSPSEGNNNDGKGNNSDGNSSQSRQAPAGQSGASAAPSKTGSKAAGSQKSGGGAAAGGSSQNGNSSPDNATESASSDEQKSGNSAARNPGSADPQKNGNNKAAKNGKSSPNSTTPKAPNGDAPNDSETVTENEPASGTPSDRKASDKPQNTKGTGKQASKAGQPSPDDPSADSQPGADAQSGNKSSQPGNPQRNSDKQDSAPEESPAEQPESTAEDQSGNQKSGGQSGSQQKSDRGGEGGARKAGAQQSGGGKQPGGGGKGAIGTPGATGGVQAGSGAAPESQPASDDGRGEELPPATSPQPGKQAGGAPDADNEKPEAQNDNAASSGPSETPPVEPAQQPSDAEVDNAARAAGLALKRLQKELDRGEVDQKLLDQLGWTKAELEAFTRRMQQQLQERELNDQQLREKSLSRKSFEEMLRSLDVQSQGKTRTGTTARDRDRQDTTGRQSTPPARYRNSFDAYQRSLSGGNSSP